MFVSPMMYVCIRTLRYLITARSLQHSTTNIVKSQFTPVRIDVPWGKIDGKLWGSTDKQPILALHGWMDNAGSFDQLAPLLNNSSILAIDLPGCGTSSWLPRGALYCDLTYLEIIRLIARHYGWERVKLLGHSLGGIMCHNYVQYDPTSIEFVVIIDMLPVIAHFSYNLLKHNEMVREDIDKVIELDEKQAKGEPPSYLEHIAREKWMVASILGKLDPRVVQTMMIRGTRRKDDGTYCYTRDIRQLVTAFITCYLTDEMTSLTRKINCPYLLIENPRTPITKQMRQLCQEKVIDVLEQSSRDFRLISLDGEHHIHMLEPDVVANEIKPFLDKYDV